MIINMPHYFVRQCLVVGHSLGWFFLLIKRYYSIVISNKLIFYRVLDKALQIAAGVSSAPPI
jgi:hypothetical protein